ncbi:MAG: hypothetical protein ACYTFI_23115 [Planctomycetota bacterium]|jgi:hypothetical protein
MIEIIAIVALYSALKKKLARKGRGSGLAFLGPVFWIVGELVAGMVVGVVNASRSGGQPISLGVLYIIAVLGALVGAVASYVIVHLAYPAVYPCPACGADFTPDLLRGPTRHSCRQCRARLRFLDGTVAVRDVGSKPSPSSD